MSNFQAAMTAMSNDPELQAKVMAVNSPAERQAIFTAAGVALPTHDEVNDHHANLASASGAGSPGADTGLDVGAGAGAGIAVASAAGAAAA